MIKRIIEISNPAYLKFKAGQLLIEKEHELAGQVPFEDLGMLILAHSQITVTQSVLTACIKNNVALVHCDKTHMPSGLTLPLAAHSLHTKVLRSQLSITPVRQKQLWQQIVKAKISAQAETLKITDNPSRPVLALVQKVKSGDSANMEAQAAQRYWKLLFGNEFKRNPDLEGINSLLNYGYAIIRATVARALVATGFHPSLGLNHSNQYNAYCLADDLMEPFRPWVDEITFRQTESALNKSTKSCYLTLLSQNVQYEDKEMPFMVAIGLVAALLKRAYEDRDVVLSFPERT